MPNWVTSYVDVQHKDPDKLQELRVIYDKCASHHDNADRFFSSFLPCPDELITDGGWYEWCVQNWGTKWDACQCVTSEMDGETLQLQFETAWSPPIAFFEFLKDRGFVIKAEYVDEAYCFIGCWVDGFDDCYGYDQLDSLPDYLSHLYTPFDEDAA